MIEEFGDALVRYPNDGPDLDDITPPSPNAMAFSSEGNWKGKCKITELPSPEELKGRILLKTKNLMLGKSDSVHVSKGSVTSSESDLDPSGSASESEPGIAAIFGLYRRESERGRERKKRSGEGSGGDVVRGMLPSEDYSCADNIL